MNFVRHFKVQYKGVNVVTVHSLQIYNPDYKIIRQENVNTMNIILR